MIGFAGIDLRGLRIEILEGVYPETVDRDGAPFVARRCQYLFDGDILSCTGQEPDASVYIQIDDWFRLSIRDDEAPPRIGILRLAPMLVYLAPVSSEEIDVGVIDTDIERLVPTPYLLYILDVVVAFVEDVYLVLVRAQIDASFIVDIGKRILFAIRQRVLFRGFSRDERPDDAVASDEGKLVIERVDGKRQRINGFRESIDIDIVFGLERGDLVHGSFQDGDIILELCNIDLEHVSRFHSLDDFPDTVDGWAEILRLIDHPGRIIEIHPCLGQHIAIFLRDEKRIL